MLKFSYYIKKGSLLHEIIGMFISIFVLTIRLPFLFRKSYSSRVLVIALHKLGDTVFTIPAVKALRNEFGKNLTIVCYEDSMKIYEIGFDDLNYLILKKEDFNFSGRIANSSSRKLIKKQNPGVIVDLTGAVNSASLIFSNRAAKIVGFNEKYFKVIYTDYIPARKIPHQMDIYLDAVKLILKIEDEATLKYFGKSLNPEGDILIHPFAGWKAKEWKLENFIELSRCLNKFQHSKIIIPLELEKKNILSSISMKHVSYTVTKNVGELIRELSQASIVVGCDSGAVNIASLLGKPTYIIYGPTNPKFHLPYGDHHDYIFKETAFSPKSDEKYGAEDAGRKNSDLNFMSSISVDEVYLGVISLFKKVFNKESKGSQE